MHKFSCKFLDGYLITYFIKGILLRSVFNNKSDSFVDLNKKILETFAFYYFTFKILWSKDLKFVNFSLLNNHWKWNNRKSKQTSLMY